MQNPQAKKASAKAHSRPKKVFGGQKLREMRQAQGLTQAGFAERLGISTSYINQIENNQRHLTAPVLLALATEFRLDIGTLADSDSDRLLADLTETLADPLLVGQMPSASDLQIVTQNAPGFARSFLSMYQTLRRTGERLTELDHTLEHSGALNEVTPYEEVRDFFHYTDNYLHDLDMAAETLAKDLQSPARNRLRSLADYIERRHRVRVVLSQDGDSPQKPTRQFDPVARVLTLNGHASSTVNAFQIAHQIALLQHRDVIETLIARAAFRSEDAGAVCAIGLANYFAGAVMLPYTRFAEEAQRLRHDLHLLSDEFGASLEQVAHRLSTLQRPGAKGVPFFFAKIDQAGNITKRHSATKLQFARFGSACPLWNAHHAFETPGAVVRQLAETPDGARYICIALTIQKRLGGYSDPVQRFALALGCETRHADQIVYADGLHIANLKEYEPIGISCRICERSNCHQRALPPSNAGLQIDPHIRRILPYDLKD